ncbi:cleft lip and palate transmembrane protein 1-domain-containing protein [Suillus subaureus]|uniref:Cleft lip and palate transmembrane protein 1-domain-containing protein n=1 Tax=Suillus subaureus TaxID=48587 RepID=A0A9P7DXE1_9AGAM|nr:cleft lip and palate transmembrane protein 1-domain-containing protein [Suillus subaureus]KAG1805182.1 cleft lip and palate transmembrane protein 1-domain-containing protein [Suillus subaureus]
MMKLTLDVARVTVAMSTPAHAQAGPPAEQDESPVRKLFSVVQQVFLIWAFSQLAMKLISPAKPSTAPSVAIPSNEAAQPGEVNPFLLPPVQAYPAWKIGQPLSMHVYFSTSPNGDVFSRQWTSAWREDQDAGLPNFVWENIVFGDWKETRVATYDINLPLTVQKNGSLWADIFLVKDGASPDPSNPSFDPHSVHHVRKLLTRFMPRVKARKEKNLLSNPDDNEEVEKEPQDDVIVSHWHKNLTLALVSDETAIEVNKLPPVLVEHVHLVPGARDDTGTKGFYKPIIFPNDFWLLRSHLIEINTTTPTLPLEVIFQPMSYFKFQIFASMSHGFDEALKQQGGGAGAELDEVKRMLTETNPWFLGLTGLVSMLHVVFEMLAFKSDVSHWRQRKELVGVSIITNVFVQTVVLLYLIDNNENTSWMILMGSGMGVVIEAWKITKAVDISIIAAPSGSQLPYMLSIKDKHVLSDDEKKTQEYDKLAFRIVSYFTIPLLAAYTIYSLIYETHKGWYSFVISTLTSFVYMFGFSVAHMPMKAMIYKTLSTVVDDLFAFCIKMPMLHRLACFRDDVVFLIFLYQRWIYRIDPKRVNEYGQVMAEDVVKVDSSSETKKDK